MLGTIKKTVLYLIVITAVTVSGIAYTVIEKTIISPFKDENKRLEVRLNNAKLEITSLKSTLSAVKAQYDIPDSTIEDFSQQNYESEIKAIDFENLKIIESNLLKSVTTKIKRNQTTRVVFQKFPITVSTANVQPNGQTTFNVGYVLPNSELPESLQFDLNPSQAMTVTSENGVQLFYVNLLAVDPVEKSALVEVVTLSGLRELLFPK